MTSQIRVDEITNRSGLGTVTIYDNGFEFTGVTTFTENVDIEGNLTIGGVLTYEDVTNIDSVGVVTARGGLDVSDTGTPVNIDSTNSGLNKIHFKTGGTTSGYLGNNSTYFFSLSDSSGNQRVRHANSGLYQVLDTSGNVIHQMSGAGKIGIGTAPVGDLTVLTTSNGYVDISGSGGNGAEIKFLKKSDKSQTYTIQNNGGANELAQHVLASTSGQYSWYIGGQNQSNLKLRITSGGLIGIGTISPSGLIHAHAASGTQRSYLEASASHSFLRLKSGSTSYNSGVEFFSGASNIANINGLGATGALQFEVNGSERLRIDSSGRVAVGSNSYIGGAALAVLGTSNTPNTYGCFAIGRVGANPTTGTALANIRLNGGAVGTRRGAEINAYADANWSDASSHPTRLTFHTVASGSTSATERLRITSGGITEFLGSAIKMPVGASDPGSAATGWAYYNSSNAQLRIYDGSTWGGVRFSTKGSQTNPATSSSDLSASGALAQYYFAPDGGTAFQNYACGGLSNLGTIPSGGPSWVSTHSSLIMIVKGQVGQTSQYVMSQGNYLKFVSESISRTTNTPYIYWAVFDSGTLWGITRTRWTGATYSTWGSNHDWDTGEPNPPSGTVNWDVWKTGSGTTGNALSTNSYTVSNDSNLVRAVLPQQSHNNAANAFGIHYKRLTTGEHYPWFNSSGNITSNGYYNPSSSYNLGSDTRYVHYIYLADS